jgi:hypothetical protein
MNNAEVLVKFKGDTKDLDTKTKNSQSALKGFAKTIGAGLGTAVGVATSALVTMGVAISNLTKQSVEAYSQFEQLEGGLESMFGAGSEKMLQIMKDSEDAYKTLTMSQNEYLTAFESAFPLVNSGLSKNANAIEYTNKVLQLSSDLFNTYGGSIEYYQNAINWALKGSFVYLDNLNIGIKGTQEGFIEAANASGILGRNVKNVKELTNDEIINVIQHYAEEYGVWGRTSLEASDTIIGSLNQVKATWNNFILGLSKKESDLDGLIDNLINSAITFGDNIVPVIIRAVEGIANALPLLATKIGDLLPDLIGKLLPPLVQAVVNLTRSLVQNLPQIIKILFDAIVQISIEATKMLPEILNAILVATLVIIEGLANVLPDLLPIVVEAILGIIPVLIENIPLFIKVGMELLVGLIVGIVKAIPQLLKTLTVDVVSAIIDTISKLPKTMSGMGSDIILGLWKGIKDKANWVVNQIKSLGSSVIKAAKKIFGIASPSKVFAEIGQYNVLGLEKGMEDMQPQLQHTLDTMFDLQPNISGSMSNTLSPNLNVVVNNNMELDPLGQVVNKIKTFSGGAKNDYNWGATQ